MNEQPLYFKRLATLKCEVRTCAIILDYKFPFDPSHVSPYVDQFESVPLPKCKHEKSREVAFKLLNELNNGCTPNLKLVRHVGGLQ